MENQLLKIMNKLRLVFLIFTLIFLLGCSKDEDETSDPYFNHIIFVDNFNNNTNNWDHTGNLWDIEVSNGVLNIENLQEFQGCITHNKQIERFKMEKDFSISYSAKIVNLDNNSRALGFVWGNINSLGRKYGFSYNREDEFILSATGPVPYVISRYAEISGLVKDEEFNDVKITQRNGVIVVVFNNVEIFREKFSPFEPNQGNKIGFRTCEMMTIEIDNLLIEGAE